jgi:hypothetical protein
MNAMLRILCLFFILVGQLQATSTNGFQVTVELQDGSRVVGQAGDKKFEFHSKILGELKLPLEQITSIDCQPKTNAVKLTAANGDKLVVSFAMREIRIETSFGDVKLPVNSIRHLQVSATNLSGRTKMGLVALWSGEGNGMDSINGNTAIPIGHLVFSTGKRGQAFFFDGNNTFLQIPAGPALDVGKEDGFTIECWIKPTTVRRQQIIAVYEKVLGATDGADTGLNFVIQPLSMLYANIAGATVNHEIYAPANLLVAGAWQHIAMTYDKASGLATLYINGVAVTQTNLASFTPKTDLGNLLLGAGTAYGSVSNPRAAFSGGMDEIGIYNRALSAAEIQALCTEENNGEPPPPPSSSSGLNEDR